MSGGAAEDSGDTTAAKVSLLAVSNIEVVLRPGRIITLLYYRISFTFKRRHNMPVALVARQVGCNIDWGLFPPAAEASRTPNIQKHAAEHRRCYFIEKQKIKKTMRLITNYKTEQGLIPFSCFYFRYFCDESRSRKDTLVPTVTKRQLIKASCQLSIVTV